MAQDLTSAVLCKLQVMADAMFPQGGPLAMDYDPNNNQAATVGALFRENATDMRMLYNPDGTCRAVEANWIKGDFTSDTTDYSDGFADTETGCDLNDANEPVSEVEEYAHNLFESEEFMIQDDECDNLFVNPDPNAEMMQKVGRLYTNRMLLAMKSLRRKLNLKAIAFLNATKTGIDRSGSPFPYITFDGVTDTYEVDQQGFFSTPHSLTEIAALANNSDMFDWFMISGISNFYKARIDDSFFRLDDDKRNVMRWDTVEGRNYFDQNLLDATLTGKNTFVILPGSYAAWNVGLYTGTPVLIDTTKQLYQYSVTDPNFGIVENGVFRNVVYNVRYQKDCIGTDVNGVTRFKYRFEVRFLGGLQAAPPTADGHSGILHVKDVFVEGI